MFATKTHFEQVPLEIVNQIVEEQIKHKAAEEKQASQAEENEGGGLQRARFGTARERQSPISKDKSCKA